MIGLSMLSLRTSNTWSKAVTSASAQVLTSSIAPDSVTVDAEYSSELQQGCQSDGVHSTSAHQVTVNF